MPKFNCDILSNFQTMWLQFCIFSDHETRVLAKAGDAFCFLATLQHCAMPNLSQSSRSVILIQYLAKYVRPMEDQKRMLKESVSVKNHKKHFFEFRPTSYVGESTSFKGPEKAFIIGLSISGGVGWRRSWKQWRK